MSHHAQPLAEARTRWDAGDFDPASPSAQRTLSEITAIPLDDVPRRRNRMPRRLAAAVVVAVAVSIAAITIPGATPDVIAQTASALGDPAGGGITFSGELRYGNDGDTGNAIHIEGSQNGAVGALVVRGDDASDELQEQSGFASTAALFRVALSELRELLEGASAGENDSVRVVGETTVAGHAVYELDMDLPDAGSLTLFVDRENYLPVRFETVDASGSWAMLDFARVERMTSGE